LARARRVDAGVPDLSPEVMQNLTNSGDLVQIVDADGQQRSDFLIQMRNTNRPLYQDFIRTLTQLRNMARRRDGSVSRVSGIPEEEIINAVGRWLTSNASVATALPQAPAPQQRPPRRSFSEGNIVNVTGTQLLPRPASGDLNRFLSPTESIERQLERTGRGMDTTVMGTPIFTSKRLNRDAMAFVPKNIKVGRGISLEKSEPNYLTCGSKISHLPSLRKGVLRIRNPSGSQVLQFPPENISSNLAHTIENMLSHKKLDANLYSLLSNEDQNLFAKMAEVCGITESVHLPKRYTDLYDDDMKRFDLLRGSVIGGQNAPEVLSELKDLTLKLMNVNLISVQDGTKILSIL
jgi:hypothetical protein